MTTGNTQSPSRQPATTPGAPGGPGRLSKYIVAGLMAALVLAVFLTPGLQTPPTAEAQATILVKNTGQNVNSSLNFGLSASTTRIAQGFSTGSDPDGYRIASIGIRFKNIADPSTAGSELTATLNTADSLNPGNVLCTLHNPSNFTSSGIHTFDVPDTCPFTNDYASYYLVLRRANVNTGAITFTATDSSNQDTAISGWGVDNVRHSHNGTSWSRSSGQPFMIEVRGTTAPKTWVSNTETNTAANVSYSNIGANHIAQGFRTGNGAGSYEVTDVLIRFERGQPDRSWIKVWIVESSSLQTIAPSPEMRNQPKGLSEGSSGYTE